MPTHPVEMMESCSIEPKKKLMAEVIRVSDEVLDGKAEPMAGIMTAVRSAQRIGRT